MSMKVKDWMIDDQVDQVTLSLFISYNGISLSKCVHAGFPMPSRTLKKKLKAIKVQTKVIDWSASTLSGSKRPTIHLYDYGGNKIMLAVHHLFAKNIFSIHTLKLEF